MCAILRTTAVLGEFGIGGATVVLRETLVDDVRAIVDLIADDQLAVTRDGINSEQDSQSYLRAAKSMPIQPTCCWLARSA